MPDRCDSEVKEMKRMLVILLVIGLLMGTISAAVCEDENPPGTLDLPDGWPEEPSVSAVTCGGGGGTGGGGIPG
jgi:hypothetical protein